MGRFCRIAALMAAVGLEWSSRPCRCLRIVPALVAAVPAGAHPLLDLLVSLRVVGPLGALHRLGSPLPDAGLKRLAQRH